MHFTLALRETKLLSAAAAVRFVSTVSCWLMWARRLTPTRVRMGRMPRARRMMKMMVRSFMGGLGSGFCCVTGGALFF